MHVTNDNGANHHSNCVINRLNKLNAQQSGQFWCQRSCLWVRSTLRTCLSVRSTIWTSLILPRQISLKIAPCAMELWPKLILGPTDRQTQRLTDRRRAWRCEKQNRAAESTREWVKFGRQCTYQTAAFQSVKQLYCGIYAPLHVVSWPYLDIVSALTVGVHLLSLVRRCLTLCQMIYEILQSALQPSASRWRHIFSLPISTFNALGCLT